MSKTQYSRFIWIVNTLYITGGVTFKELNERWMISSLNFDKKEIPQRSFNDDKNGIEEVFGIKIGCNASNGYKYFIENLEDIKEDDIKNWLLSSFSVNNMIQESKNLKSRIVFDKIPSGNEYLISIIDAMNSNNVLRFVYQPYYLDTNVDFLFEPYCVKVFKQRWYVIGKNRNNNDKRIERYALDRILKYEVLADKFEFPDTFDSELYFKDSFGIIVDPDDYEVEVVKIKVFDINHKRKYFRSLPLHSSQKEIEKKDDDSIIEYVLYPSYDFIHELLYHGKEVQVISPKWVVDEIKYIVTEMCKKYKL